MIPRHFIMILILALFLSAPKWSPLDQLNQLPPKQRYEQLKKHYLHNNTKKILQVIQTFANQFKSEDFLAGELLCALISMDHMNFDSKNERQKIKAELGRLKVDALQSTTFIKSLFYYMGFKLYYFEEDINKAINQIQQALTYAQGIELIPIYLFGSRMFLWNGDITKALEFANKAKSIIVENHMDAWSAKLYANLGDIYSNKGDFALSNDYLYKSLDRFKKSDNFSQQVEVIWSIVLNKIYLSQYDLAIQYLIEATDLFDKPDVTAKQKTDIYIMLAKTYTILEKFDLAIDMYTKSKAIALEQSMELEVVDADIGIASCYISKKQYDKGIQILHELEKKDNSTWARITLANLHIHLATAYSKSGLIDRVEKHLLIAIDLVKKFSSKGDQAIAYNVADEFYTKINDYKNAYKYAKAYYEINQKISSELLDKKIYAQENKYLNIQNQQKQIVLEKQQERLIMLVVFVCFILIFFSTVLILVKKSIEKTKLLNIEKLNSEIRTRSLLDQMQPHFLFNSLNSISNLIYESTDKADEYIVKLSDMYRLILQGSQSYTWEISNEIKLVEDYLKLQELRFEDQISYQINYQDHELENVECPCLMLHTLVENAIKHGVALNPEGGQIIIKISRDSSAYRLSVENTGSGDDYMVESRGTGTGIENTRKRLKNMYGSKYRLLTEFSSEWSKVEFFISGEKVSSISD